MCQRLCPLCELWESYGPGAGRLCRVPTIRQLSGKQPLVRGTGDSSPHNQLLLAWLGSVRNPVPNSIAGDIESFRSVLHAHASNTQRLAHTVCQIEVIREHVAVMALSVFHILHPLLCRIETVCGGTR